MTGICKSSFFVFFLFLIDSTPHEYGVSGYVPTDALISSPATSVVVTSALGATATTSTAPATPHVSARSSINNLRT